MRENEGRYALLIDADNVSAKYIKPILDELSKYGNVTYKRIYADWTTTHNANWKDVLLKNSISPIQQYSYTTGKNATDSAMIIDAMDILYTGKVDGFCLVSSDSDFTRLASRLRESGQYVIGMGEAKTPGPFRQACDKFTILELLLEESTADKDEKPQAAARSKAAVQKEEVSAAISRDEIEEAVIRIITENQNNDKETGLGEVGSRLVKLYPDFDVRNYGYSMLYKFLDTFPKLKVTRAGSKMTVSLYEDPGRKEKLENYILEQVQLSAGRGIELGLLGQKIHLEFKDFKVRDYGYSRLKEYISSIPRIQTKGEGKHLKVMFEEEKTAKRKAKAKEADGQIEG